MSPAERQRFEQLLATHYEGLKGEVLETVRGKLAADNLHPDPSDLDAAYNGAWHGLFEQFRRDSGCVNNLGGFLATASYRRAIDEIRASKPKYRAPAGGEALSDLAYVDDVDSKLANRQKLHQWWTSVRLRLNPREQQALSLCLLHEYSRKEASEIMKIDERRLDKIMVAANKKVGGLFEAIKAGAWCEEQRSLIKAFALGWYPEGGERHALAMQHVMECPACAAYVRSLRGLTALLPAPALLGGTAASGGGILGSLAELLRGGASGATAGGGAAVGGGGILAGVGAKGAVLCIGAVCITGGALVVVEHPAHPDRKPRARSASLNRPTSPDTTPSINAAATSSVSAHKAPRSSSTISKKRTPPDPNSAGAQQIAEFGVEPQATSSTSRQTSAASVPRPAAATEFGIEGP